MKKAALINSPPFTTRVICKNNVFFNVRQHSEAFSSVFHVIFSVSSSALRAWRFGVWKPATTLYPTITVFTNLLAGSYEFVIILFLFCFF